MSAPSTDSAAIKHIIQALFSAGYSLSHVNNGEDDIIVRKESDAIKEITAVDQASLFVTHPDKQSSFIYFVLGNEPLEVACDYGMSLDSIISPLVEKWMNES